MHVEQFKKTLAQEIAQHSQELAQLREQRKGLEMVISDLFAIKAKHASEPAVVSVFTGEGEGRGGGGRERKMDYR